MSTPKADKPQTGKPHTDGQRAYEARRAAKAGVSLEKWMAMKARDQEQAAKAERAAAEAVKPRKPGLISRLLDRAHKPI